MRIILNTIPSESARAPKSLLPVDASAMNFNAIWPRLRVTIIGNTRANSEMIFCFMGFYL